MFSRFFVVRLKRLVVTDKSKSAPIFLSRSNKRSASSESKGTKLASAYPEGCSSPTGGEGRGALSSWAAKTALNINKIAIVNKNQKSFVV